MKSLKGNISKVCLALVLVAVIFAFVWKGNEIRDKALNVPSEQEKTMISTGSCLENICKLSDADLKAMQTIVDREVSVMSEIMDTIRRGDAESLGKALLGWRDLLKSYQEALDTTRDSHLNLCRDHLGTEDGGSSSSPR